MGRSRFTREDLVAAPEPAFSHPRRVRMQDVDAAGIIFYSRALEIMSDALFASLDHYGYPGSRIFSEGRFVTPVKHCEVHYLRPLRLEDRVRAGMVLGHVGESDFTFGCRIFNETRDEISVVGQVHQVCVDTRTFRRIAFTDEFRAVLEKIGVKQGGAG